MLNTFKFAMYYTQAASLCASCLQVWVCTLSWFVSLPLHTFGGNSTSRKECLQIESEGVGKVMTQGLRVLQRFNYCPHSTVQCANIQSSSHPQITNPKTFTSIPSIWQWAEASYSHMSNVMWHYTHTPAFIHKKMSDGAGDESQLLLTQSNAFGCGHEPCPVYVTSWSSHTALDSFSRSLYPQRKCKAQLWTVVRKSFAWIIGSGNIQIIHIIKTIKQ